MECIESDNEWAQEQEEEDLIALVIAIVGSDYATKFAIKTPCRTAPFTGHQRVQELLLSGHARRCQEVLRMPLETFNQLVIFLKEHTALHSSRHITIEEKLCMFLYTTGNGASNRAVQEAYQHSGETVSRLISIQYYL